MRYWSPCRLSFDSHDVLQAKYHFVITRSGLPASAVYIFHGDFWFVTVTHALLSLPFSPLWLFSLDEVEEVMKITLLQRKRNQLAGYCKLVIYGVLDLTAATNVFKHYSKVEMET